MPFKKLIIHAPNVHQGGGRALLEPLLRASNGVGEVIVTVDERMSLPPDISQIFHFRRVKPSFLQRLITEKLLTQVFEKEDVILCFGNLLPLFSLRGRTIVFL